MNEISFTWGEITQVSPLRVKLDGDTAALPFTPESLVDPLTLAVGHRVRCELSGNRLIVHGRAGGDPDAELVGSYKAFACRTPPTGYLKADGSAVSRSTYARLFEALCEDLGTITMTIASPAVVTRNGHGLVAGDKFYFETTGALPTGVAANTIYYVLAAGLTSNTFRFSATDGGSAINTSGSQSGTHKMRFCPYGLGNGSTTFNLPDIGDYVLVGQKNGSTEFGSVGRGFGAKTHTLTLAESASANINIRRFDGDANDYLAGSGAGYGIASPYSPGGVEYNIAKYQGGDGPHNNMQPSRAVLWCIKT